MPYVMTLKEGADFYIQDVRFTLSKIDGPAAFTVVRGRDGMATPMVDGQTYEIAPGAKASVGTRGTTVVARLAVEAPKSVLIDPGVSYREAGGHTKR